VKQSTAWKTASPTYVIFCKCVAGRLYGRAKEEGEKEE
jgi:hypothetical protein